MTTGAAAKWVADKMGVPCSPRTVQCWITVGANGRRLAATRVGHRWAVSESDLISFLGAGTRHTADAVCAELAAAGW